MELLGSGSGYVFDFNDLSGVKNAEAIGPDDVYELLYSF